MSGMLLIFGLIYLVGNVYIFSKMWAVISSWIFFLKWPIAIFFVLAAISSFLLFALRGVELPFALGRAMYRIGTGWLVWLLYLVIGFLLVDLLKLLSIDFRYSTQLVFLSVGALLLWGYHRYTHPERSYQEIAIDKPLLDGTRELKVAFLSDVHLGYGTDRAQLEGYLQMLREEQPDLILIAGDLIDYIVHPLYQDNMLEPLKGLSAPLGVYMSLGNHEYLAGRQESIDFIRKTSIRLLIDEAVRLPNGLQIVGRDDATNPHRQSYEELIGRLDHSLPCLVLDHRPDEVIKIDSLGVDLQLSGHTHHGQVWPGNLMTDYLYPQSHGYKRWGKGHAYVSEGLSLWGPPFRIATRSELVLLTLKFNY